MKATAANVVRLPSSAPVKLDDGPKTAALVQREIFRSGWSYVKIAHEADLCIGTVQRIATGETKRPAMRSVMLILAALGWEVYASERSR
jgi:hypothetical protein